jgi:hypothetical protein
MPQLWKRTVIVPIYERGDKADCSNYKYISLLPTTYKIIASILPSRLTPYVEEITGDHQHRLQHNRSTINYIFSIHQIQEKKWE